MQAAGAGAPGEVRSVIIVTLDTTRADHVGCYGYFRDTTPGLDAFARQSVRFTRCFAPIAQTTPSHASLFTGVYPCESGVTANSFQRSATEQARIALRTTPTFATLAEVLRRKGLKTGGFVSGSTVKSVTGLSAGFDTWSEPKSERRIAKATIDAALQWLDSLDGAPCFLWIHLFDAHGPVVPPVNPPPEYLTRYPSDEAQHAWLAARDALTPVAGRREITPAEANNIYDGKLRFQDDEMAPLFARLDQKALRDSTVVAFVGDHGHGLGQHRFMSHGIAYAEQLQVPFLLRAPGLAPGVLERLISTIDVVPTLLALAPALRDDGFLEQCRGRDALAHEFEERPLFGMSAPENGRLTLFSSRWKLILERSGKTELFDMATDPFELKDVAAELPEVVARIGRALLHEFESQQERARLHFPDGLPERPISAKLLHELEALGYVGESHAP